MTLPGNLDPIYPSTRTEQSREAVRNPRDPKIDGAAAQFESILLTQWLGSARESFGSAPGSEEEQDGADEQWNSFASQMLAQGIVHAGGIGLGDLISNALRPQVRPQELAPKVAGT